MKFPVKFLVKFPVKFLVKFVVKDFVLGKMSLVKFPVKFLVKFLTRCFVIKSDQKNSTENSTDDFTTHPGIPYFTLSKSTPNQSPFTSSKAQLSGGRMQIAIGPSVPQ